MLRQKERLRPELIAYQEARYAMFQKENQKQPVDSIIFAGDSIVEFFPLKKYLGRSRPLLNRGVAGTGSQWLLDHLPEQVVALSPSKLFLLTGTNDIGFGEAREAITQQLNHLIVQLKTMSHTPHIYLLSVLPVNETDGFADTVKIRTNQAITKLNHSLRSLAGCEFIDVYPFFLDNQGQLATIYTTDGLHLSQAMNAWQTVCAKNCNHQRIVSEKCLMLEESSQLSAYNIIANIRRLL